MNAQWKNSRHLEKRLIVSGQLKMVSPAHLGCGDTDSPLDMPILRDPLEGKPLLAGATLAGALRAYLSDCGKLEWANALFGDIEGEVSYESPLAIDDAIGDILVLETRDGVAINPDTRTAKDKHKYDFELMSPGVTFPIRFELNLTQDKQFLIDALAIALRGLENGEISLGKRKRRGFGECCVDNWKVWVFDWNHEGLKKWLTFTPDMPADKEGKAIDRILLDKEITPQSTDKRFIINATFTLDTSILIRSKPDPYGEEKDIDYYHLRDHKGNPIISGTSITGVLRARILRIAKTFQKDGVAITDQLFGCSKSAGQEQGKERQKASRVWVKEPVFQLPENPLDQVQSRVGIDRFTSGAMKAHLFSERPEWGSDNTKVSISLGIHEPTDSDIGFLLLALKDLWTGDLTIGAESSIGRGIFKGETATLQYGTQKWVLTEADGMLSITGKPELLNEYVHAIYSE